MSPRQPVPESAGLRRSPGNAARYRAVHPSRKKRMPSYRSTYGRGAGCVLRQAADDRHARRLRAIIVVLWPGGLPVQEALAMTEHVLYPPTRGPGACKGRRRRELGTEGGASARVSPTGLSCRSDRCSASLTADPRRPLGARDRSPRAKANSRSTGGSCRRTFGVAREPSGSDPGSGPDRVGARFGVVY